MTNGEFLKKLDELYSHYKKDNAIRHASLTDELKIHLLKNIEDKFLNFQVKIKDYALEDGRGYLYTDIGTFPFESKCLLFSTKR